MQEEDVVSIDQGADWHIMPASGALSALGVSALQGLDDDEAARRLVRHGANALPEESRRSSWRFVLSQFQSPLIYILFAAAVFAFALGKQGDALVILIVVLVNALIGALQESRAERSMAALRRL